MSCCNEDNFDGGGADSSYALPEQWGQNDVAASQAAVVLGTLVSQLFDDFKMQGVGSILGLSTRFSEAITAGTATVIVTKNGVPTTLQVVHTSASNPSGGIASAAPGAIPFVPGDLIGMTITTTAGFLPTTTDLEAWILVT